MARLNRRFTVKQRRPRTLPFLLSLALGGGSTAAAAPPAGPRPGLTRGSVAPATAAPARGERGPSTLDGELEQAAERLLRSAKPIEGAMVAIDPRSGHVLAFEALSSSGSSLGTLTRARLPAASLFKIVTTAALFETTPLSPQDQVCISGGTHGIERRHLEPARGAGVECGRFAWALGHSKNAVFAQLATRLLTRDDLLATAERLGFNTRLPLDGGEQQFELGKLSVPYNDLEFARTAAGFQGSSLSPIGAAYLMTLIARNGAAVDLRLHEDVSNDDGAIATAQPSAVFSARTAQRLARMLEVTVETGTSRAAFTAPDGKRYLPGIKVAGKTGTLRPGPLGSGPQPTTGTAEDTMTSWFVGFAPSRNPEIVVSVMLVNGKTYRRKANELARDLLRTYFRSHGHAPTVTDPFAPAPDALAATAAR